MKYIITILMLLMVIAGALFTSSFMREKPAGKPTPLKFLIPKGWPKPSRDIFAGNPLTVEGFSLGKKLFYDGNLSADGQTSCGSCHQQFAAFSTYDHDLSHGVNNSFTQRNAPALFNLAWSPELNWDGGVNHLEVQALSPMTAANEMGETLENILAKLRSDSVYRRMFRSAFGNSMITSAQLMKALAQFTGSLVSAGSRYDNYKNGLLKFTAVEERGYTLYKSNCAGCHPEPLFTDHQYRNNGLSLNRFKDAGRQRITNLSADSLRFRVPSLRNVQYTAPYMHDGRFNSLDKVINHYNHIPADIPTLDASLKNSISISEKDKQYLIYFLYALTDTSFTTNKRFAPDQPVMIKH